MSKRGQDARTWPNYGLLETVLVNLLVKVVRVDECALR